MSEQGSELPRSSLTSTRRFALAAVASTDPPPDPTQAMSLQLALSVGPASEMTSQASTSKPYTLTPYATSATSFEPSKVPSSTRTNAQSTMLSKVPSTTLSKTTVAPCSTALSKVVSAPSATASVPTTDAWRSPCGAAGRDSARCQKRIRDLIGKHETKNVELEKREGMLHRRLQMLECSMPAVMVWQAWRTQATPEAVHKLVAEAASGSCCKVTPSQHYDCRVREIEARRKEACRRAEAARCMWLNQEATLQGQEARLELARQQQEERRACIERLEAEARKLGAPCGEGPGRSKWPQMSESESSLHPEDLECLSRLETLAEAEACMKRQIAELEAKEQAYMCALARAEELCSNAQPLESESRGIERGVGRSEPSLRPSDKDTQATPATQNSQAQIEPKAWQVDRPVGGADSIPTFQDQGSEAAVRSETKETSVEVETASKSVAKAPKCRSACVGRIHSQANKSVSTRGETRDKNVQSRSDVADKSESTISPSQYGDCGGKCAVCPCKGVVDSRSGMMDTDKKQEETKSAKSATSTEKDKCSKITVARADIRSCQDIVSRVLQNSELSKLPSVAKDMEELKGIIEHVLETAVCYEEPLKSKSKTTIVSQSGSKKKVYGTPTSSPDWAGDRGLSKKMSTSSLMHSQATVCLAERSPFRLLGSFLKGHDTKSILKSKSSISLKDRKSVGTQMSQKSQSTLRKTASKVSINATSIGSKSQKPSTSTSMSRSSKVNIAAQTTPSASRSRTILPSTASTKSKGLSPIKSTVSKKTAPSVMSAAVGVKSVASTLPSAIKSVRSPSTKTSRLISAQGSKPTVTKSKSLMSAKPSTSKTITALPSPTKSKTLTIVPSATSSQITLSRQPSKAKSLGSISVKSSRNKFGSLTAKSATVCSPPLSKSPSKFSKSKFGSMSAKSATVYSPPPSKSQSIYSKSKLSSTPQSKLASEPPSEPQSKSATESPFIKSSALAELPCLASRSTVPYPMSTTGEASDVPFALPCIALRSRTDSPRTSVIKDSPQTSMSKDSRTSVIKDSRTSVIKDSLRTSTYKDSRASVIKDSPQTFMSKDSRTSVIKDSPRTLIGSSSLIPSSKPCAPRSTCTKSTTASTAKSKCSLTAASIKSSTLKSQRSVSPVRFELKSTSQVASSITLGTLDDVPYGQSQTVSSGTQAGQYLATQRSTPSTSPSAVPSAASSAVKAVALSSSRPVKSSAVPSAVPSSARPVESSVVPPVAPSAARSVKSTAIPSAASSSAPPVESSAVPSTAPSAARSVKSSAVPSAAPSSARPVESSAAPSIAPLSSRSVQPAIVPTAVSSALPEQPSAVITAKPSTIYSAAISAVPSAEPKTICSATPSAVHSRPVSAVHSGTSYGICLPRSKSKHSGVPTEISSSVYPPTLPKVSSATPCEIPSAIPSAHLSSAPSELHSIPLFASKKKSQEIVTKSYDYSAKSMEEVAKSIAESDEITTRSEIETRSKILQSKEASSSHRSVRSTCTPKEKSQKSLQKEQPSCILDKSVSIKSISKSKSDTVLTKKASQTSSKKEPEPLATPKESKILASAKESKVTLVSSKNEKEVTPKTNQSGKTVTPKMSKSEKTVLPKTYTSETVTPKTSKSTVASTKRAVTTKTSKSTVPSIKTSKTSKTSKKKSSLKICKSKSAKSVASKCSTSQKELTLSASQASQRSKRTVEVKEPKIPETEVRSDDLGQKKSEPEEVVPLQFTIELSMTKIDLLASVEVPPAIEAASRHSGDSDYHECVCDLREIYPPAPRSTAVQEDLLVRQNKQEPFNLFQPAKPPQRAAATKLICGCSEEQERRARTRTLDKAKLERCPHYPWTARRRRRRRRRVPPRFCECVRPPPPMPRTPPTSPSRCHLCGGPLLPPANPPSACSSGDAGRPAERIIQCPCERPGSEAPRKRDQGVLAKLPKPEKLKHKKHEERDTLQVLFDRTTRRAEQFLATLRYGPPKAESRRCSASPTGSCTCPRNSCNC